MFYLVIDRDGEEEMVYFLTEITENDLLNVTTDNSETLPKNSAALESQIPVAESALPNNNTDIDDTHEVETPAEQVEEPSEEQESEEPEEPEKPVKSNPILGYIIMAILGGGVIGAAYYFKVVKKKQDGDFYEDEDEDPDEEVYPDDAEEEKNEEDDFLDREYDGEPSRPANDMSEEDVTETVEDADTEEE